MRISIDFYIFANGYTGKRSEVFMVPNDFKGEEDAIKIANLFIKQLRRSLEKNEEIVRVEYEGIDITSSVNLYKLRLVK